MTPAFCDLLITTMCCAVYPTKFTDWLKDNEHVWDAFVAEAFRIIDRGFTHYSARTLVHYLRHHSAVAEHGRSGWKINDHHSPYLARLFCQAHPGHDDLWELREVGAGR